MLYEVITTALGVPDMIKSQAEFSPTGSEESINIIFKYNNGAMASLTSSFAMHSPVQTDFCCENGYVTLHPRWFTPTDITIWRAGQDPEIISNEHKTGSGYQFEAQHVMECLDAGLIESPKMSWSHSKNLMGIVITSYSIHYTKLYDTAIMNAKAQNMPKANRNNFV